MPTQKDAVGYGAPRGRCELRESLVDYRRATVSHYGPSRSAPGPASRAELAEVDSRQLVTRARRHLEANRPRFDADEAARDALLERFLAAPEDRDLEALEELLAKDAVL
jgi:hypothetical protein